MKFKENKTMMMIILLIENFHLCLIAIWRVEDEEIFPDDQHSSQQKKKKPMLIIKSIAC